VSPATDPTRNAIRLIPDVDPSWLVGKEVVIIAALFAKRAADPSPYKILAATKVFGSLAETVSKEPIVKIVNPME
jgi:hypothetical protein